MTSSVLLLLPSFLPFAGTTYFRIQDPVSVQRLPLCGHQLASHLFLSVHGRDWSEGDDVCHVMHHRLTSPRDSSLLSTNCGRGVKDSVPVQGGEGMRGQGCFFLISSESQPSFPP